MNKGLLRRLKGARTSSAGIFRRGINRSKLRGTGWRPDSYYGGYSAKSKRAGANGQASGRVTVKQQWAGAGRADKDRNRESIGSTTATCTIITILGGKSAEQPNRVATGMRPECTQGGGSADIKHAGPAAGTQAPHTAKQQRDRDRGRSRRRGWRPGVATSIPSHRRSKHNTDHKQAGQPRHIIGEAQPGAWWGKDRGTLWAAPGTLHQEVATTPGTKK